VESGTVPPVARHDGPWSGAEEQPIAMSAAASSDGDGHALSYAWTFGDGSSASGRDVTHTYMASGTYQVRLIVTDVLGLADTTMTTASVRVLTVAERLAALVAAVRSSMNAGAMSQGNGTALLATLSAATEQAARGNSTAAYNQLGAFVQQVEALSGAGRIPARDAADWLAAAQRARDRMQ
jgi:PKD repeat protein